MAGHSKWAQIKHKKGLSDTKRGQLFSKLVREITIAARSGGASPDTNSRLRAAIERARAEGLPKDNVERALGRVTGEGEGATLQEFLLEATAPGGVSVIIEVITDNKNRTINEIRHLLSQYDGRLADPGSVAWNFAKVGIVEVRGAENTKFSADDLELLFIESGATDFKNTDGVWMAETRFAEQAIVRQKLEQEGILVHSSGHDYNPKNPLTLGGELKARTESLLDHLSEQEDVQEVYTNLVY